VSNGSRVAVVTGALVVFPLQKRRQTRIIYATLAGSLLASLIWLIALCTNGWVELILPEPGVFLPSLQDDILGRPVLVEKIWTSVWHVCRVESANDTRHDADATFSTDAERPKHRGIYLDDGRKAIPRTRAEETP